MRHDIDRPCGLRRDCSPLIIRKSAKSPQRGRRWLFGCLAVAAAFALSAPLHAGKGPVARPFKGSAQGYIVGQIPPNGLLLEMSGQATHLGHFTREEHAFLGADGSVVGTIVFTAANGDELWVEIDGAFTSTTDVEGLYIIRGGTGRFQGATGQAHFKAYTPDFHYAEVVFDGTVAY